ncbi:hypothetical protein GCM10010345_63960 [Streptomyces canarius]|uniref:Uncharacterized protein n=1 Tax=Streptomyces canarius TaxID=285453 RepID=A0ABQ3CZQ5_9ACTN|nr:hypothetical protein GCM10010345_63960 [Streptomyces canarius]
MVGNCLFRRAGAPDRDDGPAVRSGRLGTAGPRRGGWVPAGREEWAVERGRVTPLPARNLERSVTASSAAPAVPGALGPVRHRRSSPSWPGAVAAEERCLAAGRDGSRRLEQAELVVLDAA